ncbi:MAG: L,D-transpeptidase [Proteobacteria bacterium]|nr:L,D-transpeptidase [Pseudomonadota bacterium]
MPAPYPAGTIVVSTSQRRLYFVLGNGSALRYPVAVGRPGKQWFGQRFIDGKFVRPAWSPPEDVRRDNPNLPNVIAGGARNNPMGERCMTISPGQYAVHGTNVPGSIGTFASYGCVRMYNHDIVELFERVPIGAPIIVVR